MKKFLAFLLTLMMLISGMSFALAEDITLDVIIAQYGPNTNDWFLGTGMNGTNFVDKFEAENPAYKKIAEDTTGTTYEYSTYYVVEERKEECQGKNT